MARAGEEIENSLARMRTRFVRTAADTDGELLVVEATYGPGSVRPPEHLHPVQTEDFEIVAGSMRARVDGKERTLTTGERLHIPPGTVHAMWNEEESEAKVIWQTRPALRTEDFFIAVSRLSREGKLTAKGAANPLLGAAFLREFRREFRPTSPPAAVQTLVLPVLAAVARLVGQRP